jgi:hypothetical protein
MVDKFVTKAELSRIKGATRQAITKAVRAGLHKAMVGNKINLNHELVQAYLNHDNNADDLLYADAVEYCHESGRFTASAIARKFKIGHSRSTKIFKLMQLNGIDKPMSTPPPKPPPAPPKPPPPPLEPGIQHTTKTKKARSLNALNESDALATGQIIHDIPDDILAFIDMTLRELIQRYGTDVAFIDWLKSAKLIEDINEKRLKNAVTQGDLVSRDLIKIGVIDPINAAHIKLLTDGAKTIARRVTAMHGAGRSIEDCEKFVADQMTSFIRPIKSKVARALKNA